MFQVTEIEGRSALLKWGPPVRDQGDVPGKFDHLDHIGDQEFRYEVCLSDKGKDGKYRTIFTTPSIECRLTDLRPCTEYHIRIHAMTDALRGGASDTVSFVTKPSEPDKPAPPKLVSFIFSHVVQLKAADRQLMLYNTMGRWKEHKKQLFVFHVLLENQLTATRLALFCPQYYWSGLDDSAAVDLFCLESWI